MKSFAPPLLLAAALVLGGCNLPEPQADTVRHFTLSGPASGPAVANATSVRLVRLAGHLRSRAMAVRVSENEVVYLQEIRWAEPLDEAITQVLRNRLRQVASGAVVNLQIQRCEVVQSEGNAVQLSATYTVTTEEGEPKAGAFTASERHWDGKDPGALVGLIREAVAELADSVAEAAQKK